MVMAAFSSLDLEYIEREYHQSEWFRKPSFAEFVDRMEAAKRDGFSIDRGNRRSGLTQIAVPVFSNSTGKLTLIITVIDYKNSFTEQKLKVAADAALTCADRISSQLSRLQLD